MNEFVGKKVDVYIWNEVRPGVEEKSTVRGIVVSQEGRGRQSELKVRLDNGCMYCVSGWLVTVVE